MSEHCELIFVPFREAYRLNPELVGDISPPSDDARVFCKFLGGNGEPAFGQMLTIAMKSVKSPQSPFSPFAEWLKKTHRSYFGRIGRLRKEMMIDLRNREDHLKKNLIAEGDAEKMLEAGMEMVSLILEVPARKKPG